MTYRPKPYISQGKFYNTELVLQWRIDRSLIICEESLIIQNYSKIFKLQSDSVKQVQGAEIMGGSNLDKQRLQWIYCGEKENFVSRRKGN